MPKLQRNLVLIHNCYFDSKDPYGAYIVLQQDVDRWSVTRFFKIGDKIQVSVDHENFTTKELLMALLYEYSSGLK